MNITIKNFQVKETGYWSGESFNWKGSRIYVPFHNGLYKINIKLGLDEEYSHRFHFFFFLPDWISQRERREGIYSLIAELEGMESLDELKAWKKEFFNKIDEAWLENNTEYV